MFIPADGLNYETANAFISVEYADDFHSLRGNTSWAGTDAVKQAAIVKATDYIEQIYSQRFIGMVVNYPQILSWPRANTVFDDDVIPSGLKNAVAELAIEALSGQLIKPPSNDPEIKSEQVDVIKIEYFASTGDIPSRPAVRGFLSNLLLTKALNVPVIRV